MRQRGFPPLAAGALAAGAIVLVAVLGRKVGPKPDQPRTRRWYDDLDKPAATPPGIVFAPAWALLETAMGYSAYRLLKQPSSPIRNAGLVLWAGEQVAIGAWSGVFFGNRKLGPGAAMAGVMTVTAAGYAFTAAKEDEKAGLAALPLVGWLAFATYLATEIWRRNPDAISARRSSRTASRGPGSTS